MNQENTLINSLNIGLSLSGGGYRAAGYHLGLLTYLNKIGLLSQVTMLSTVSGGTFTGAKYALSLVEGKTFQQFYREYYSFLKSTPLVELALGKIGKLESSIPSSRKDLITAAAQVYAETFLAKRNGEPYYFEDILKAEIALKEIVFNSTEFRHGLDFRFQSSDNPRAVIGNNKIRISKEEAAAIRIADIVAASSCFPGGFEPLAFPGDFHWRSPQILERVRDKIDNEPGGEVPIMDGGIYDNQGVEGLRLADERNGYALDLFIISDVDQKSNDLYGFPTPLKVSNLSLNWVDRLSKILILLCFITLGTFGYQVFRDIRYEGFVWLNVFLNLIPLFLAAGVSYITIALRNLVKNKILLQIPQVKRLAWSDLKQLTVNQVVNGVYLRITSLQALAGSVFMKRIRSMGLKIIYQNYRGEDKHRAKVIANFIYKLETTGEAKPVLGTKPVSEALQQAIDSAANMPTTLWFTDDSQLDNLVICGQATICYNLMRYVVSNYGEDIDAFPADVKRLWLQLVGDWSDLCSQPRVLHEPQS